MSNAFSITNNDMSKMIAMSNVNYNILLGIVNEVIGNGGPSGVFDTLQELNDRYPKGAKGVFLITINGKWYYWNGSEWTVGGVYQATQLEDGSVSEVKLELELQEKIQLMPELLEKVNDFNDRLTFVIAHNGDGKKDTELIDARGGAPVLSYRLNDIDAQLADTTHLITETVARTNQLENNLITKASISYVDTKVQGVSLAWKESYATLTDLQNAYPDGDIYNHVVLENNMIYSWKNTWTNTQVQANGTGVANKTVTPEKTNFSVGATNNLLNPHIYKGYGASSTTNSFYEHPDRSCSDFIEVKTGDVFYLVTDGTGILTNYLQIIMMCNEDKVMVQVKDETVMPSVKINDYVTKYTMAWDGYIIIVTSSYNGVDHLHFGTNPSYEPFLYALDDKFASYNKNDFEVVEGNLVDTSKSVVGYLTATNGIVSSNQSYYTSNKIPVAKNTPYVIMPSVRKLLRFNKYGYIDYNHAFLDESVENYQFTPLEDGYIRFSYPSTAVKTVVMKHANEPETGVSVGDSIMWGAGNSGFGIADLVAEELAIRIDDYSVPGATIGYQETKSHVVAQIEQAITEGKAPKVVLINGGINDVTFNIIGEISNDYNYTSHGYADFSSGLEYCFGLLKDTWPTAQIIYIWPHHVPSRNQTHQKEHHDRAVEICSKWSIAMIDLYKDGGMNTMLTSHLQQFSYYPNETTGTHPNELGYRTFYIPPTVAEIKKRISL